MNREFYESVRQRELLSALTSLVMGKHPDGETVESHITSMQRKWRDAFVSESRSQQLWDVIQTGAGQSYAIGNGTLTMQAGTTANVETILQSKDTFTIPMRLLLGFSLNQRIANQEIYFEFVSVDPQTGIADGQQAAAIKQDGTNIYSCTVQTQADGGSRTSGALALWNVNVPTIAEIELTPDETKFANRNLNNATGRYGTPFTMHVQQPDPNAVYKLRIRVKNLAVAPASNTTLTLHCAIVTDISELTAEITGGRGGNSAGEAIPVNLTHGITISSGSLWNQERLNNYEDTTTPLAGGGTFTGTTRDMGAAYAGNGSGALSFGQCLAAMFTDQPGTLIIEMSNNATTWRTMREVAYAANAPMTIITVPLVMRYWRVRAINGATAQGAFHVISGIRTGAF